MKAETKGTRKAGKRRKRAAGEGRPNVRQNFSLSLVGRSALKNEARDKVKFAGRNSSSLELVHDTHLPEHERVVKSNLLKRVVTTGRAAMTGAEVYLQ
jgi:hypothetical protein